LQHEESADQHDDRNPELHVAKNAFHAQLTSMFDPYWRGFGSGAMSIFAPGA
jgi:hypothetical protein